MKQDDVSNQEESKKLSIYLMFDLFVNALPNILNLVSIKSFFCSMRYVILYEFLHL